MYRKESYRGAGMALLVKPLTLSSGHDLLVLESTPVSGSAFSGASACPSAPPALMCALFCMHSHTHSQINKQNRKKIKL